MSRKLALLLLLAIASLAHSFVKRTIIVDTDFSDWDTVLSSEDNTVSDPYRLAGDGDSANIQSDADDLRLIAATWDTDNFYFYFQTGTAILSPVDFIVYMDVDRDGKMGNSTTPDRVLAYSFKNSGFDVAFLYFYVPVVPSGDVMGGDGSSMPGTFSEISSPASMIGANDGSEYGAAISWADLGPGAPTAPILKVSTQDNSSILDNTGLLDLLIPGVLMTPDNFGNASILSSVQYEHSVTNESTGGDILNISASSSEGYPVSFERWDGSAWTTMLDADGSGTPDLGSMASGETRLLRVTILVPVVITQTTDLTTVVATSSVDTSVYETATDTTNIGIFTISPNHATSSTDGVTVRHSHIIANHQAFNTTLGLSTNSDPAWTSAIFGDPDCNGVEDGPAITSIAINENASACIVATVGVPGGTATNTVHTLKVRASETPFFSEAIDTTTVAEAVVLSPDGFSTITGSGTHIFFEHTVTNNQAFSDSFDLNGSNSLAGWMAEIFAEDGITPINSIGPLDAFGGNAIVQVKVTASPLAQVNDVNNTIVTATSTSGPESDTATDITKITDIATYENASATIPKVLFDPCKTVHARGFNLTGTDYRVRWFAPGSVLKREVTGVPPDGGDQINDSYQLLNPDPLGIWVVEIAKKTGNTYGEPIIFSNFLVSLNGGYGSLDTSRNTYFYQGPNVTVSSSLINIGPSEIDGSIVRYVIYKDMDGSTTPTNNDLFLMSNGQVGIFDGTVFSYVNNLPGLNPLTSTYDPFTITNANFGISNTGTWNVYSEWKTACGGIISSSNITFQVIAGCTPTTVVGPVTVQNSGANQLISWPAASDPCLVGYAVLGSTTPNPPDWNSLVEATVLDTSYLSLLPNTYYHVVVKSIDGSLGPR